MGFFGAARAEKKIGEEKERRERRGTTT